MVEDVCTITAEYWRSATTNVKLKNKLKNMYKRLIEKLKALRQYFVSNVFCLHNWKPSNKKINWKYCDKCKKEMKIL